MIRLSWKLTGAILLVVIICVGLMAYLVNLSTAREFRQYILQGNMMHTQQIADSLSQFYSQNQQWPGVDIILEGLIWSGNTRLVVADSSGLVVGDTNGDWLGRYTDQVGLEEGTPVTVSGNEVGEFYPLTSTHGHGQGQGQGTDWQVVGQGASSSTVVLDAFQQDFLDQVNRSLWLAGAIGTAVALLFGFILARYFTRPINELSRGAHHIASGDLKYRVKVGSKDEIGELAQTFNSMASGLEMSEQSRRQLMADVAHELRTPLTVIGGTIDGMLDGVFKPDPEHLGTIKEQSALLTRLIGDLRDLSLAESGQLKLEKIPTDMVELVRRILSQFEVSAKEKGNKLQIKAASGLPQLTIDPVRIVQAISNLLANALRHTPAGGTISISMEVRDNSQQFDKKHLLISVADTGEGIPPEHLSHIFDRFYRAKPSRSRSEGGAGLGLAIAKQMVQAHNGRLWVESELGKGSIFYIALPIDNPAKPMQST